MENIPNLSNIDNNKAGHRTENSWGIKIIKRPWTERRSVDGSPRHGKGQLKSVDEGGYHDWSMSSSEPLLAKDDDNWVLKMVKRR